MREAIRYLGAVLFIIVLFPASASAVVLTDTYWGGNAHGYGDVIGGSVFNIVSADITRPNANTLQVVINTAYAGHSGTAGTGYGSLFLTPGANAWTPITVAGANGGAPRYVGDQYQAGDWTYAFDMPGDPSGNSGNGGLYTVSTGTVVMSHGTPGSTFRDGQAVQFTPGAAGPIRTGTWSIINDVSITFVINDNGLLGNSFALAWGMDCANDEIQGQVNLPPGATGPVPEASTWAMMLLGFAGLGFAGYRRRLSKVSC